MTYSKRMMMKVLRRISIISGRAEIQSREGDEEEDGNESGSAERKGSKEEDEKEGCDGEEEIIDVELVSDMEEEMESVEGDEGGVETENTNEDESDSGDGAGEEEAAEDGKKFEAVVNELVEKTKVLVEVDLDGEGANDEGRKEDKEVRGEGDEAGINEGRSVQSE